MKLRNCLLGWGCWSLAMPAAAAVVNVGPADDVEAAINAAQPGDEIGEIDDPLAHGRETAVAGTD